MKKTTSAKPKKAFKSAKLRTLPYNSNVVELFVLESPKTSIKNIQKICFDKTKTPFVLMDQIPTGLLAPCILKVQGETFLINNLYDEVRDVLFS